LIAYSVFTPAYTENLYINDEFPLVLLIENVLSLGRLRNARSI